MPPLSRRAIRAASCSLACGVSIGAWLLAAPAFGARPPWELLPLHLELLLIGWLMQFAMGVAHWILPRLPGRPAERGRTVAAIAAIVLLNAGAWMAGLGPLLGGDGLLAAGRLLELSAAAAFVVHAWPRVRSVTLAVNRAG